ncbi:YkvS family protein [Lentibacillus amyloliquefaciens]|uniref:DUF2187 domain-containing protein n=1 Tax=Lentibacillus amyloliquefaciens TaxID=1472767 RepID=A0A0U4DT39_9BACI|nr:DUF2187 family protein [Lentibacillus amyloliquefaciens]ALX48504.1 hypothetical protein AOX59_07710 [Lentibacillus amyloliquefaciens]
MFKPDQKKAKEGDTIEFELDGMLIRGKVLPSKTKNSIVVDITSMKNYEQINQGYPNTVVSHKSYRVIEESDNGFLNTNRMESVFG